LDGGGNVSTFRKSYDRHTVLEGKVLDLASYCLYIAGHLSDELFAVATSSRPSRAEGLRHLTYGHRISGCQIAGILFVLLRAFVVESLEARITLPSY
jgi:hypothetical protein